nr:SusC/RagA family TonB-linked outer membrane protein [Saprospiraceae bacterium]
MIGSITYLLKKTPKCLSIFLLLVFMLHDQPIRADSKFVGLDVIVEEAKIITGRVFDANNEPLIGATVLEKGTSNGVVTDIDGKFSISVDNNSTALMISYVGYVSQEVDISSSNTVEVVMLSDATTLNEVTVIGYGSVRKSDLSGSVSSVKGTDLKELPTQRVDQALQGRAAGVSVQNTDGSPGGSTIIRIRGGNSVNGGNNALVVVDGLQGVDISTINPNDIETVEVLKDASATAVYGARGANGVIIVTTKRGSSAKPVISYNFSGGSQSLAKKLDLLSPADFARKSNVYAATQNGTPAAPIVPIIPFTESQISGLANGGGTDWQDELYRAGSLYNHQLSITGGNNQARYYVSGGMVDQQGIVINSQYKRYNLRSNLDLKVNDWLSGGFNLNVIKAKGNVPPVGEGTRFGDI